MAGRKSKYYSDENIINKKIWSAALYIRLSQEDEDNGQDKQESNSVTSQKTLLNEFIEEHDDLIVYDTYIDDGFTGTDFNRPSFQRLLEDMRNGNINCVIVKDLSRLGRNYIEVGNYIEQVFPLFNIRINHPIHKIKFGISLMLPFVIITFITLYCAVALPQFAHYFLFIFSINVGMSFIDFIYLKYIINTPKGSYIEERKYGFEILTKHELSMNYHECNIR